MNYICLRYYKGADGSKYYLLQGDRGSTLALSSNILKQKISTNQIKVNNLTLTSDGKLRLQNTNPIKIELMRYKEKAEAEGIVDEFSVLQYGSKKRVVLKKVKKLGNGIYTIPNFVDEIAPGAFNEYVGDKLKVISNNKRIVKIDGVFSDTKVDVLDLVDFDVTNVKSMTYAFSGSTASMMGFSSTFEYAEIKNMSCAFKGCKNLKYLDIQFWNVREVTDMHEMFKGCARLAALNLRSWSVYHAINMEGMFANCISIEEILMPQVSLNVMGQTVRLNDLLAGCKALEKIDMSHWDIYAETVNCYEMLCGCNMLNLIKLPHVECNRCVLTRMLLGSARNSELDEEKISRIWSKSK